MGLLLNHKPFLSRCNIIKGEDLTDAWGNDVVTNRNQFKTIMRRVYGSQSTPEAMWEDMDIPYTQAEVDAFNYELQQGEMSIAESLKNFMIDNCNMKPVMDLVSNGETYTVNCNKHFNVGETTTVFDLYDTPSDSIRTIHHTETVRVPDLNSFRRYTVTGLIHNLDSQVEDNTTDAVIDRYGWALPIHDATILCCEAADYGRDVYANGRTPEEPSLKQIHTNRNSILSEYFTSIGISAAAMSSWKTDVMAKVEPLTDELVVNPLVLK